MRQEPTLVMCLECGACCCKGTGALYLDLPQMRAFKGRAALLGIKITVYQINRQQWVMPFGAQKDKRCAFLGDDDLCTIYADRPLGCRYFPQRPEVGCLAWPKES